MKEYENPTITISMFDMENVVTASGTLASEEAQKALKSAGVENVQSVSWTKIIG
jgi:hypothetical protein